MPPRKNRSAAAKGTAKSQEATTPAKRKVTDDSDENDGPKTAKRSRTTKGSAKNSSSVKQTEISTTSAEELEKPIIINRAPVLELWGACVAHFLHPELSWNLCLSIGSSIKTITAISKGRSIGKIAPPDQSKDDVSGNQDKKEGDETIRVMGFPMTVKDDSVMVKGKPKTTREANIVRKYGSEEVYEKVKDTMTRALGEWRGKRDALDTKAFHMYEEFRPDVAKGQKGWGRKGELHLSKIRHTILF